LRTENVTNAGKNPSEELTCPRCRIPLRTVEGSAGLLYRCSEGHGYMALSLLEEQSKLAARILGEVEASLDSQIALATEMASKAEGDGQRHLEQYLERVREAHQDTLGFVQSKLRPNDEGGA